MYIKHPFWLYIFFPSLFLKTAKALCVETLSPCQTLICHSNKKKGAKDALPFDEECEHFES